MRDFRKYEVYTNAIEFAIQIYQQTMTFPDSEKFGLTNQLRRAAVSISANISEGSGRNTTKEFAHFVSISKGSSNECETLLSIAYRLGFIEHDAHQKLVGKIISIQKQLGGLHKHLSNN